MSNLGASSLVLLCFLVLCLPRRLGTIPMIIGACYLTFGQSLNLFSFNFYSLRILILFGWIRIVVRKEFGILTLTAIDKIILLWVASSLVTYVLLYQTSDALVYKLGFVYNTLGLYFFFRVLIRNLQEFNDLVSLTAIIAFPVALLMCLEQTNGRNFFSIFGGVNEISELRDGYFRSQGAFQHPILAGTFGATLMPLVLSLWWKSHNKITALIGVTGCSLIVITSRSSGPLMAYVSGIIALSMWRYRGHMKIIRWSVAALLLSLHLIMKAPVWYLFDRIAGIIGGGGWYRAELINQAVENIGDWWLIGTQNTASWFAFSLTTDSAGINKADITNQFVGEGVNGGLITLVLFVVLIIFSFRTVGRVLEHHANEPFSAKIFLWSMGCALFSHVMSFFSVAYFDQITVFWFLLLAAIASVGEIEGTGVTRYHSLSSLRKIRGLPSRQLKVWPT
jgi:hypothetical protein